MRHRSRRLWASLLAPVLLAGVVGLTVALSLGGGPSAPRVALTSTSSGCSFLTSPAAAPAFCDSLGSPAGTGNRSGDLNGTLWGVSRATSNDNGFGGVDYNWAASSSTGCGAAQTVQPDHDVKVCNGQAVEAVNDNEQVTVLGMYPKQPFDFAGRTGTVVFDVSNDSQGNHAAWPAFVITDQPVPAPYGQAPGVSDDARNSIGFSMAGRCGQFGCGSNLPPGAGQPGFDCISVDSVFTTSNYQYQGLNVNQDGCVLPSSGPGQNNHVEVQLSPTGMKVYASDPGQPSTTRLIADASFTAPLTRGLIWMEDVHYNAGKFNTQEQHSFSWANVGYDGPVLRRDLAFDAPDALTSGSPADNGQPTVDLGYYVPSGQSTSVTVQGVYGMSNASAALLTLTYWPHAAQTLTYAVNGHPAHQFAWPFGANGQTFASQTVAMPVPLTEVQAGNNTVQVTTSDGDGLSIANIDLVLVGAGGLPGPPPPPTPTPTPKRTHEPVPMSNVPCTVVIQSQSEVGQCTGTFIPG